MRNGIRPNIRLGLELMLDGNLYKDERLGIITNHTGLDSGLNQNIDVMLEKGYTILRVFAPEHGLYGDYPDGMSVPDSVYGNLKVVSLFGERPAPIEEGLEGLDRLIFDIQDIGSRYYTYMTTMITAMKAAAAAGIPFTVLDRPNPLGGLEVEGNIPHPANLSVVCGAEIPIRHGMTLGEIALMVASRHDFPVPEVVPMRGWRRSMKFEDTGLVWVPTSPAASSLEMVNLYPGTCLIEGTNVSEGRGTSLPFCIIGAPWIDGLKLALALRQADIPGVFVRPVFFRPTDSKYKGKQCQGVQIHIVNSKRLAPVGLGVRLLFVLRDVFPKFCVNEYDPATHYNMDQLAGGPFLRNALAKHEFPDEILDVWLKEAQLFKVIRRPYLLYPER